MVLHQLTRLKNQQEQPSVQDQLHEVEMQDPGILGNVAKVVLELHPVDKLGIQHEENTLPHSRIPGVAGMVNRKTAMQRPVELAAHVLEESTLRVVPTGIEQQLHEELNSDGVKGKLQPPELQQDMLQEDRSVVPV